MKTIDELKFVLKLLGCSNYRSLLSAKVLSSCKRKHQICQDLNKSNIVDFTQEIKTIKLLPTGREILKLEDVTLLLNTHEKKILELMAKTSKSITPSNLTIKSLKSTQKEVILQSLVEKGFIAITSGMKRQKAEVWLTDRGLSYLRNEFIPDRTNHPVISLALLGNYLTFLRTYSDSPRTPITQFSNEPNDEEILQLIKQLDRQLKTNNYLPIFYLREKLQPPLSREELDRSLYRLQRADKIELSTIVHTQDYTPEQLNAGIEQRIGIPLFFIEVI